MFPQKLACPKVPIKEEYSATDNLSELNFIGEGTAGERIHSGNKALITLSKKHLHKYELYIIVTYPKNYIQVM